jgi:phosphate transport system substrate-binding protein
MLAAVCSSFTGCANLGPFDTEKSIDVVSREEGSGTRGAFVELFGIVEKSSDGTKKKDRTSKEAVVAHQTGIMMTNISGNTHSIGYISLGSLNDTVKLLQIDGVTPTAEAVKDASYPIVRPFNILTKDEPTGLVKDFISFILSADGQAVIAESYITVEDNAPAYTGSKPAGKIVVVGSSSVYPVMEKLKEAYLARNKNAAIEVQMSDSAAGIQSAIDGICDIGMSSRDLTERELAQLQPTLIALDAIAIVVNKKNPATSLTKSQVKDIFTGAAKVWNEVLP